MTTPLGDALTRWTIRIALALAVAAMAARIADRNRPARLAWSVGCLAYLAHVVCAFHFYHDWSHSNAYAATARDTAALFGLDWGGGLYVNYGFTLVWIADVVWWWVRPASYETRPRWANVAVYGFFAFMAFNGTVVFASGPTRWIGLAACMAVSLVFCLRVGRK
jgi:hypothetical protein